MDWDLKLPWDLSELDQSAEPNMGSMAGSNSELPIQGGSRRLDCSVDLKLGGFGDSRSGEKWRDRQRASIETVSPSKRPRPQSGGSQKVSCLVDGCKADLSKCREYHRKHKVCEVHSKTRVVMVAAQEQRFCQQCSRFHPLAEFDDDKRSCRKRLDGHNRRRRKPQPVSISSTGLFTNYQGSRSSSYFQMFPTAMAWPAMKTEDEQPYNSHQSIHILDFQQQRFSSSFSGDLKDEKHFPFLQDSNQPLLNTISFAESNSNNNNSSSKVLSDCALSLLSSPLQTSAINGGRIVPTVDRIRVGQPSLLSYSGGLGIDRYSSSRQESNGVSVASTGFSCSGIDNNVFVSDASDPEMSCQGFSLGGEGSSDGGSQALPFTW